MYDTIIIGAGPAGMMASIRASENKHKVLLIEKNDRLGKKLRLTGGTRCNLTNLKKIDSFIKEIPVNNKFLYSSLNQFGPQDIYDYFTDSGVALKVEDNDRVFPISNKAQTIIDILNKKMIFNNVDIHLNETVKKIINHGKDDKEIITDAGTYKSNGVIIATGGCTYPQTGSTGDGYRFCEDLKQPLTDIYPAETFLISKNILPLAGITLDDVDIKFDKYHATGSILFTHFGISGPATFKISEKVYHQLKIKPTITLYVDLIPNYSEYDLMQKLNNYESKKELISFVREYLPRRLSDYIVNDNDSKQRIAILSKIKKQSIITLLKNFQIEIKATGLIEQSFISGGGVDIKHINPKTMESTKNSGIYFAGELLDLHGHMGGYNITIALSTGFVAGTERIDVDECTK